MELDIDLYDPTGNVNSHERREVSLKKLRSALKMRFDNSPAFDSLKAQLRNQILTKLLDGTSDTVKAISLKETVSLSCIFAYLKHHGLHSTLSVFSAEAGLENDRGLLSELDIARMMKFTELSQQFRALQARKEGALSHPASQCITEMEGEDRTTLLDLVLEYCLSLRTELVKDSSVQAGPSSFTPRELLDHELYNVEKQFQESKQHQAHGSQRSVEDRVLAFQRELEMRKNREVEVQVEYFKQHEAGRIRLEEAAKQRTALEKLRQDLEHDYQQRLRVHAEREAQAIARGKEMEARSQQSLHDARQQMQRELEDVQSRERMTARKVDLESQGLALFEIRLKESQVLLESRERELRRLEEQAITATKHAAENARKEAQHRLSREFDELQSTRFELLLERRKVDEDKAAVQVEKEAQRQVREEVQLLRERLAAREGEVNMLKWNLAQLQAAVAAGGGGGMGVGAGAAGMYAGVEDESSASSSQGRDLTQLDRLAAETVALRGELTRARQEKVDETVQLRTQIQNLQSELESTRQQLAQEKQRSLVREHKVSELQQILREKSAVCDTLTRQVEAQARRERSAQQSSVSVAEMLLLSQQQHQRRYSPMTVPESGYLDQLPSQWPPQIPQTLPVPQTQIPAQKPTHIQLWSPYSTEFRSSETVSGFSPPAMHTSSTAASSAPVIPYTGSIVNNLSAYGIAAPSSINAASHTTSNTTSAEEEARRRVAAETALQQRQQDEQLARQQANHALFEQQQELQRERDKVRVLQQQAQQVAEQHVQERVALERTAREDAERALQAAETRRREAAQQLADDERKKREAVELQLAAEQQRVLAAQREAEQRLRELDEQHQRMLQSERDRAALQQTESAERFRQQQQLQQQQQQQLQQQQQQQLLQRQQEEDAERERLRIQREYDQQQQQQLLLQQQQQLQLQQKLEAERLQLQQQQQAQAQAEAQRVADLQKQQQQRAAASAAAAAKEKEREAEEERQRSAAAAATAAAEAAEREKEAQRKQQEDDDAAAAISEARARVLARRREKAGSFSQGTPATAAPASTARSAPTAVATSAAAATKSSRPSYDMFNESDSSDNQVEIGTGSDDANDRSW